MVAQINAQNRQVDTSDPVKEERDYERRVNEFNQRLELDKQRLEFDKTKHREDNLLKDTISKRQIEAKNKTQNK